MKFKTIVKEIEAVQIGEEIMLEFEIPTKLPFTDKPYWLEKALDEFTIYPIRVGNSNLIHFALESITGENIAFPGEWIIKEENGLFSTCSEKEFENMYEEL